MRLTFFWMGMVVSGVIHAAPTDRICTDLYGPSCAPGQIQDPTGTAKTQNYFMFERAEIEKAASTDIQKIVDEALADPKNSKFIEVAIDAFGLDDFCNPPRNADCVARLKLGLTTQLTQETIYPEVENRSVKLKDLSSIGHLSEHPAMLNMRRKIGESVRAQLKKQNVQDRIENEILPRTQTLVADWVLKNLPAGKTRDDIYFKVNHIEFAGFDCAKSANEVPLDLQPNAFYSPRGNKFTYCAGSLLFTQSIFSIVRTIAHELTHSFDPCSIQFYLDSKKFSYGSTLQSDMEAKYPLTGVIACLRRKDSFAAEHFPPSTQNSTNSHSETATSKDAGSDAPSQAEEKNPPFDFCTKEDGDGNIKNGDQITESIADWVAADILPDYVTNFYPTMAESDRRLGYLNTARAYCKPSHEREETTSFNPHPTWQTRMNAGLLANPKIRAQLGCHVVDPNFKYKTCHMNEPSEMDLAPMKPPVKRKEDGAL